MEGARNTTVEARRVPESGRAPWDHAPRRIFGQALGSEGRGVMGGAANTGGAAGPVSSIAGARSSGTLTIYTLRASPRIAHSEPDLLAREA